jgi:tetratricopeptide (TPR) repeat protein/predicted regulator of Ras-like GTPase activity (Roadblock/LC7/MglB family)
VAQEELLDAVIKSYQDKLRQNPDSLVFVQLADALRKKGQFDEALAACRSGLTRHPNLLSGQLMMGRVFTAKKEHGEAVEVLKRVVQREPNNLTAHALLSQAYMALGRFQEAIGEYQKILSLNPEDAAAQSALQGALDRMRRERSAASAPASGPAPVAPVASGAGDAQLGRPGRPPVAMGATVAPVAMPAAGPARAESPPPIGRNQPVASEVPAYAAAMELAERGLYDEAIEALQHVLEADPDNFMARQKLREVYAQREAVDTPTVHTEAPATAGPPAESQADKISDDEILYLLGLMETGVPVPMETSAVANRNSPAPASAPAPAPVPAPVPAPTPAPAPAPAPAVAQREVPVIPAAPPAPVAPSPVLTPPPAESPPQPAPPRPAPPVAPPPSPPEPVRPTASQVQNETLAAGRVAAQPDPRIVEILNRLAATSGMRSVFLVSGHEVTAAGAAPSADRAEKIVILVRMLSDVTRRTTTQMKQGEMKQLIVFGTEGMAMVCTSAPGILAAVAGAGVNVGLLRIALNDCLKRLGEVS